MVKHAHVTRGELRWHQRGRRAEHGETEEHEGADQVGTVRTVSGEYHNDMLTFQLVLGSFEQSHKSLPTALGKMRRRSDVEHAAAQHGIPRLGCGTGAARSCGAES